MIYFTVSQVCCPSLKGLFIRNLLKQQQKKKMVRKKRVPKKNKKTFHVHIGTVKFATQFKESLVAHWLHFQGSVRKGMVLTPAGGVRFGPHLSFRYNLLFFSIGLNQVRG